eukprot:jgi/Chlat1/4256/Chrsp27S00316
MTTAMTTETMAARGNPALAPDAAVQSYPLTEGQSQHGSVPIAWTIAGSDSGGGAGIQADVQAMRSFGVHACTALTALTAQNTQGVAHVQLASPEHLRATLKVLADDLPANAVKLGMLGSSELVNVVADFLDTYHGPVVVDPVMVATSGASLLAAGGETAYRDRVFGRATILTPNIPEAEQLLGKQIASVEDMESAAKELQAMGPESVLIKGGHQLGSKDSAYAQDCHYDGHQTRWLTYVRVPGGGAHGSGCTLASAAAAGLAKGQPVLDSIVAAKAYVTRGVLRAHDGPRLSTARGPQPVAPTSWPPEDGVGFPWITDTAHAGRFDELDSSGFKKVTAEELGFYVILDSTELLPGLFDAGVRTVQIRIKDDGKAGSSSEPLSERLAAVTEDALTIAKTKGICDARIIVNDDWRVALQLRPKGVWGLHLGQSDLPGADLKALREAGLVLGVSSGSISELAIALGTRPSYIAVGSVYATISKETKAPVGLSAVRFWRAVIPRDVPIVAIGGIGTDQAQDVLSLGADSIAVISAITHAPDPPAAARRWLQFWQRSW